MEGEYHDNLYTATDWFRPFDCRGDLGMAIGYGHFLVDTGFSLGFIQSNWKGENKVYDWRYYIGLSLVF